MRLNIQQVSQTLLALDNPSLHKLREILRGEDNEFRGYLTVFNIPLNAPVLIIMVGEMPSEKSSKYRSFSIEKAARLADLALSLMHRSSWESRNPDKEQWGGAVLANNGYIFSFSGLPELADEALALRVAISAGMIEHEQAQWIANTSKNPYYRQIHP